MPKNRTKEGGLLCCPKCKQSENGFTQREKGVIAIRTMFFDGDGGEIFDTEFEHTKPSNTGKCNECGHIFIVNTKSI